MRPHRTPTRSSLAAPLAACLAVALAGPGDAAAAPVVDARYRVETMGVELGRAALSLEPVPEGFATRFNFANDSLLGFVEASDTLMRNLAASTRGEPRPMRFEGVYTKEDRAREVAFTYDAAGQIDSFRLVKRDRARVTAVPDGLAPGTVDPLTALLRARAWLGAAAEGSTLALPIFDGRKRYDATMRYLGLVQLNVAEATVPAHRLAVRYTLTTSLDEDTGLLEPERDARPRDIEVAVSADGRYVPLRLDGSLNGLPVTAELAGDCAGPMGCGPTE
jgi:hypothetical protein